MTLPRWKMLAVLSAIALTATLLPGLARDARAFPVATDPASYQLCGRVFPDPHAYWPSPAPLPGQSPWAKGNATCRAVDFLSWQQTLDGLEFLASDGMFGDFIEIYDLSDPGGPYADALDFDAGEGLTAGLPRIDGSRERHPMIFIRVTDEEDTGIAIEDREHFVYTLSLHGIERAGVEGGIRAIEDLATWASCEKHGGASPANCAQEDAGPDNPHPLLETVPDESTTAGEALRQSSVWFVLSNPDGWVRGDKQDGGFFYQRYNGNGMDLNRDWPAEGFTFRPYTPWSEPENRTTGKALQAIKDDWAGGVDLHGQLIDRAFSFTLIGGSERPFGKDRRVLQYVKGAWADAEARLAWNPLIKGNDEPEPCVFGAGGTSDDPNCDPTNRMYGVQWGTIWDTIDYTVSGAIGDWMDNPRGLNADAIDNEMSLSHLGNCGIGTCYLIDFEQLHVDGNKSLIFAMIHYTLTPEDQTFRYDGRAAYLHNPRVIADLGAPATAAADFGLPPQAAEATGTVFHTGGSSVYEFAVAGPVDGVYNGGLSAEFTFTNLQGVSLGTANEIAIDRQLEDGEEPDPQRGSVADGWQTMNSYFNQAVTYAQGGARIDVNGPPPGLYRLRVTGEAPVDWSATINFTEEVAWPDPGQEPFEATNMGFFDMLSEFVPDADDRLVRVDVDDVLSGAVDLARFDTVIAADDAFLPGWEDPTDIRATAQEADSGAVAVPAPAAGQRTDASSVSFEFDVEPGHKRLEADISYVLPGDMDIYLQLQAPDGTWSGDLASGTSFSLNGESLSYSAPAAGHYRLVIVNYAAPPQPADVTITYFAGDEEVDPTTTIVPLDRYPDDNIDTRVTSYTAADRDAMADIARSFVEQGGNLVLTDDALRALEWMELVPPGSVAGQAVYAGHVQFEYTDAEGEVVVTFDDPLAANVDQPGSAEGPNHRHQVTEPVPLGYAIEDLTGGDFPTLPQWGVDRQAWDDAGGRIAGTIGAGDVTLGELPVGDGVVRILGTLLPFPTDEFDHPFGVADYALTWTGYELAQNLFDWTNPNGRVGGNTGEDVETPTTGPSIPVAPIGLAAIFLIAGLRRRLTART
ncbi:MAG: M14 family zinc carboxypeptidase [Nitriliruptorales bacterium]|nr:M14 family zinc carboxypeptidase [Nitriliruptorales bacterium]